MIFDIKDARILRYLTSIFYFVLASLSSLCKSGIFFILRNGRLFLGKPVYDPIKQGIYNTLDSREFLIVENLRLIAHCTNHSCFGPIFKPFPDVLSLLEKLYFR